MGNRRKDFIKVAAALKAVKTKRLSEELRERELQDYGASQQKKADNDALAKYLKYLSQAGA